jgi:hypothetical protein
MKSLKVCRRFQAVKTEDDSELIPRQLSPSTYALNPIRVIAQTSLITLKHLAILASHDLQ